MSIELDKLCTRVGYEPEEYKSIKHHKPPPFAVECFALGLRFSKYDAEYLADMYDSEISFKYFLKVVDN